MNPARRVIILLICSVVSTIVTMGAEDKEGTRAFSHWRLNAEYKERWAGAKEASKEAASERLSIVRDLLSAHGKRAYDSELRRLRTHPDLIKTGSLDHAFAQLFAQDLITNGTCPYQKIHPWPAVALSRAAS